MRKRHNSRAGTALGRESQRDGSLVEDLVGGHVEGLEVVVEDNIVEDAGTRRISGECE